MWSLYLAIVGSALVALGFGGAFLCAILPSANHDNFSIQVIEKLISIIAWGGCLFLYVSVPLIAIEFIIVIATKA